MLFEGLIIKIITYARGGEVTARIKDVSEGMEAVSEMARNGQKAERTISKLNKGSMTANICNSCMKQLQEYVEGWYKRDLYDPFILFL